MPTHGYLQAKSLWIVFRLSYEIRNFLTLSLEKFLMRLGWWMTCNMLMIVLVSTMPSLLGPGRLKMRLKHRRLGCLGCVLKAILLLNDMASISLSVQRNGPFFNQFSKLKHSIYLAGLVKPRSSWRCWVWRSFITLLTFHTKMQPIRGNAFHIEHSGFLVQSSTPGWYCLRSTRVLGTEWNDQRKHIVWFTLRWGALSERYKSHFTSWYLIRWWSSSSSLPVCFGTWFRTVWSRR